MEQVDLTNSNLLGEEFSNAKGRLRKKVKDKINKAKSNIKKVTKKLKDKVGKVGKDFRNKFRKVMRKGILFNIKNNIHGVASKLYPAVGTTDVVKQRKYKVKFVNASKSIYSKLVSKWKNLGGSEDEIKNAIIEGSKKRFLKMPYKSAAGNNSLDFYSYFCEMNSYADGDESDTSDTSSEDVSQEEKVKGIRAFFAWIKGVFKKEGADENPYEDGTKESQDFEKDKKEDAGNEPNENEAKNEVIDELEKTKGEDDAGGATDKSGEADDEGSDDKILGIPKMAFWIGAGAVALIGGFLIYKKMKGGVSK